MDEFVLQSDSLDIGSFVVHGQQALNSYVPSTEFILETGADDCLQQEGPIVLVSSYVSVATVS